MTQGVGDQSMAMWLTEDRVRIAEYFYIARQRATLNLYPDNVTAFEGTAQDKQLKALFGKPLRTRTMDRKKVMWVKTNGAEVLEETNPDMAKYLTYNLEETILRERASV